jgi:hypothetical protein
MTNHFPEYLIVVVVVLDKILICNRSGNIKQEENKELALIDEGTYRAQVASMGPANPI